MGKNDRGANAGPYVGNTVGLYNYRWFVLYCLSFTLAALRSTRKPDFFT